MKTFLDQHYELEALANYVHANAEHLSDGKNIQVSGPKHFLCTRAARVVKLVPSRRVVTENQYRKEVTIHMYIPWEKDESGYTRFTKWTIQFAYRKTGDRNSFFHIYQKETNLTDHQFVELTGEEIVK